MCVEIRGVTSVGKDRCRYLSQFYLGDLYRSWGTLIDISQGRTQDLELGGAPVAYPGFQRGGCLRSGHLRKVWGGNLLQVRYEKWGGGGNSLQVRYEKWGGSPLQVRYTKSGGGGHSASGPIPLFGTQKTPTCVLPRYTSHARANDCKIHAGKG